MLLLATHFPREMSTDKDGLWSFGNGHGYPVGIGLAANDGRWDALRERYPPRPVDLRGLDDAGARRLCCPEWRAEDGAPPDSESILLYGPESDPAASEDAMAAYLDRLRALMEAGALATLFPYGMALRRGGAWVFFNREQGPVGVAADASPERRNRNPEWPVRIGLPGLDRPTLARLGRRSRRDDGREPTAGEAVHLYEGGTVPTANARHMDAYLAKLRTLMPLEAAPTEPPR